MLTKRESVSANVYVITVKIFKHSEIIEMFNSNLLKKKRPFQMCSFWNFKYNSMKNDVKYCVCLSSYKPYKSYCNLEYINHCLSFLNSKMKK